ncbi:MAG TPA: DUF5723 family protein [Bacteroidia bacterium]|nr:DUF5723 family protein [Bacteroidia bacterium]
MNKISLSIIFIFCTFNFLLAQGNFMNDSAWTKKHFNIDIYGNLTAKSNAFPNDFYKQFYYGGYLSNEVKLNAAKDLKNVNRFGGDGDVSIQFRHNIDSIFKKTGWSYLVRIAERRHLNLEMTKDFFNVGFFGNAMYENKTAQLAKFQMDFISYQQAGLGVEKTLMIKDNLHQLGLVGSYLIGRNAQKAIIDKANLFTAIDGEYLDLEINGKYNRTDSIKNKQLIPNPTKGEGFSIDLYYQLITIEKHKLQLSVLDFGYLFWQNSAIAYQYDTLFRFEGIDIRNLIDINDSLINLSKDTLVNLGKRSSTKSFKTSLPTWFQVNYSHNLLPGKLALNFVGRYRFNDVYLPFLAVGATYYFNKSTNASFNIGYGGYGSFNYAFIINQRVWRYFTVGLGTNQLEGLLMPKKANGQSIVFSIKSWF